MVEEQKLEALLKTAERAVRQIQRDADLMRGKHIVAHPVFMETVAVALAKATKHVDTEEELAAFISLVGRTVRAMAVTLLVLQEVFLDEEPMEYAMNDLRKALHEASLDTIPMLVEDIKSAPIHIIEDDGENDDPITLDLKLDD